MAFYVTPSNFTSCDFAIVAHFRSTFQKCKGRRFATFKIAFESRIYEVSVKRTTRLLRHLAQLIVHAFTSQVVAPSMVGVLEHFEFGTGDAKLLLADVTDEARNRGSHSSGATGSASVWNDQQTDYFDGSTSHGISTGDDDQLLGSTGIASGTPGKCKLRRPKRSRDREEATCRGVAC
jgi:hypothetical protein